MFQYIHVTINHITISNAQKLHKFQYIHVTINLIKHTIYRLWRQSKFQYIHVTINHGRGPRKAQI